MYLQLLEATRLVRLSRFVLITCSLGTLAAMSFADTRSVTIQSDGRGREYRRVDHDGYVRLAKRLSDKPCIQGRSWGYDRNGIWVSDGCRAVFEVGRDNRRDDRWDRSDRWDRRDDRDRWTGNDTVKVESDDGRRRYKRVDTRGGVRLVRQLSDKPCVQGRSWGYDRDEIWVDRGCRAVFEVGRGSNRWSQNSDWLPGRYRGYEDGREFILNIFNDGRASIRRNNNGRWSDDEYGTCDDSSIRFGNWNYGYAKSGSSVRLESQKNRGRWMDLRRI